MIRTKINECHHFMLMDAGEITTASQQNRRWMVYQTEMQRGNGAIPIGEFERKAATGDASFVERSEKFLSKIEDQIPVSRGWRNVDDVVGAVPNVPAYLAGHPQCMRRRERVSHDSAPLTVFMNLTSSMGVPPEQVLQRGIALLALVRLLIEHRPVELWVGCGLQDGAQNGTVAWRVDTAPLDLARAAFHIADVSMSRLFGYAMCETLTNCHLSEGRHDHAQHARQLKMVAGWSDVMYIPRADLRDPMVQNPVAWIKDKLRQYVGQGETA